MGEFNCGCVRIDPWGARGHRIGTRSEWASTGEAVACVAIGPDGSLWARIDCDCHGTGRVDTIESLAAEMVASPLNTLGTTHEKLVTLMRGSFRDSPFNTDPVSGWGELGVRANVLTDRERAKRAEAPTATYRGVDYYADNTVRATGSTGPRVPIEDTFCGPAPAMTRAMPIEEPPSIQRTPWARAEIHGLREQVTTLTRERDEARAERDAAVMARDALDPCKALAVPHAMAKRDDALIAPYERLRDAQTAYVIELMWWTANVFARAATHGDRELEARRLLAERMEPDVGLMCDDMVDE